MGGTGLTSTPSESYLPPFAFLTEPAARTPQAPPVPPDQLTVLAGLDDLGVLRQDLAATGLISWLNLMPYREPLQPGQRYFQPVQLDTTAPDAWRHYPSHRAVAVSRTNGLSIYLYDISGLDTNTATLTITNKAQINGTNGLEVAADGVLAYVPPGNDPLGGYGDTVSASVAVADLAGNWLTNFGWSFSLELEPLIKSTVLAVSTNPPSTSSAT